MRIFNEIWLKDFGDEVDFKIFLKNSNREYIKKYLFKPFKKEVYKPLAKIIRKQKSLNFSFTKIRNLNQLLNDTNKEIKPILDTYKWQCNSKRELKEFLFYVIFDPYNSVNSKKFQIHLKIQFKNFTYNEIWQNLLI
jgi:hypothetical protein